MKLVPPGPVIPLFMVSPHVPDLCVVVPTFNERDNVPRLVERLHAALSGISWEVIFVDDDSPDGTAAAAREMARTDRRVRCLHRVGRRGLSTACIEGFQASSAPYLAVMDGDLQHDERLLGPMLEAMRRENLDLVVGSRYVAGGSVGDWDSRRSRASRIATRLAAMVCRHEVSDPMSGFFMVRREVVDENVRRLSGVGFKILLDIFASSRRKLRFREMPYHFRTREEGESKFDGRAVWEYLYLLLDKSVGRIVPTRFVSFSFIGSLGVLVHMAALVGLFERRLLPFPASQGVATVAAMTFNYWLNNASTYRDRKRRGWKWFTGWLGFCAVCSLGAVANVGIATLVFREHTVGWIASGLSGVAVGAVWNFAVTSVYTWGRPGG